MKQQATYSQMITEVEEILKKFSSEDFDIDTLAENVQKATLLLSKCKAKLHKAKQDVEEIINNG
ncbi:MAG: exodeoxyribonuclease VII small subunit [Rikenellaceae bacterium]